MECSVGKGAPWGMVLVANPVDSCAVMMAWISQFFGSMPWCSFPWHWTPVFFCGCASNALRFAQGQPKGYFQMKELERTDEPIARMNVEWKLEKAEYAEFNLPTFGNIAVWQLCRERQPFCRTVMMAWIWHFGINAMVFVPMAQAPPKADAKELLYSLQSKFDPWPWFYIYIHLHPCFQPTCFM